MKRRLGVMVLILLILMGVLSSCRQPEDDLEPIVLSEVIHSIFYAPQYIALNKGFFTEEGLRVTLETAQGADKGAAAILSGSAHVALFGSEQAVYATKQGASNPIIAFAACTQRDGSFLVGRQTDPDFSWADTAGKVIIGGRKGGIPQLVLEWILKANNVEPFEDVEIIQSIALNATAQAFREGTGDYVQLWEPSPSILEKDGSGAIVAALGEGSGLLPYTTFHATKSFIEQRPDVLQKFTNAIYKAQLWMQEHSPAEIAEALAPSFADTSLEILTTVVQRYQELDAWASNPILPQEWFDQLQRIMIEGGELDTPVDYHLIVNTEFAEEAVRTIQR
ncbi:MAG: ABC transporter substrate-binding protein [Bacillota bacterium]